MGRGFLISCEYKPNHSVKGSSSFLEQETFSSWLSTGWFQERSQA